MIRAEIRSLAENTTTRRVYAYASCTTLLYAAFEQFVETVLMEFLEELNSLVPSYSDLPKAIRATHSVNSARLILHLGLDKYRNRTSAEEIAGNLASCCKGTDYQLNPLAYIDHTANLRIDAVKALFKDVGVSGVASRVRQSASFAPYLAAVFPDGGLEHLRDQVVFGDLEDLVDRRNTIAHGWPDDTLSVGLMGERIEFVRLLCRSLHSVLCDAARPHVLAHRARPLPKPLRIFDDSIVCFEIEEGCLRVDGAVIARTREGDLLEGRIVSLQTDRVPVEEVVAPPRVGVGCRLDIKAKSSYEYFAVTDSGPVG